jgi:excinuclease ABC subunit B
MAKIIEGVQLPTLVISHNKTLAAQLYREFKDFFPGNAVEYFVSYYDYYQPEAYVPSRDLYIEKDASINAEIERMRLSATSSLMERPDVVIVATVSCIYGLATPPPSARCGPSFEPRSALLLQEAGRRLVLPAVHENDPLLERGAFRIRGDVLEVFPLTCRKPTGSRWTGTR